MAARIDLQVVGCGENDERLLAEYSELDSEFYGFNCEDLELPPDVPATVEDSSEEDGPT